MSAIVVLYGLLLGAPRHHVIIKLAPLGGREGVIDKVGEGGGCDRGKVRSNGEMRRRGEEEEDKDKRGRWGQGRKKKRKPKSN